MKKTIKDKLINNAKNIGITLMPFSICTNFGKKHFGYDNEIRMKDLSKSAKNYFWTNLCISFIFTGVFSLYGMTALDEGSLDCRRWPEIRRENIKEERKFRNSVESQFYLADRDKNGFLDRDEFYEHRRRELGFIR